MKFSISGEIDGSIPRDKIDEKFLEVLSLVKPKLKSYLETQNYGEEVELLFICPIIMKLSKKMIEQGWHKERKLFKRKDKSTDFRLMIDYNTFKKANLKEREKLLIENIINSVRLLESRTSKNFDGKRLESDILKLFNYKEEDFK